MRSARVATRGEVSLRGIFMRGDFHGCGLKTGEPNLRDIDGAAGITDTRRQDGSKERLTTLCGSYLECSSEGFDFILFGTGLGKR